MTPANATAAIIIVGNEILSGRTRDANACWLAQQLTKIGVLLRRISVIPDVRETIVAELNALRFTHDYVIICGGIGPTPDDVTRPAVAAAFGVPCEPHPEAVEILQRYYGERATPRRMSMAELPRGCELIYNPFSGAPGCRIDNVFVLPGIPDLVQGMFPQIAQVLRHGAWHECELRTQLGESEFADLMEAALGLFPGVDIGSYPSWQNHNWRCTLVFKSADAPTLQAAYAWFDDALTRRAQELGKPK
ncbi:MAG: molybdopterin-binding protein [bacterium]|nr:molybdopterin-binding protein [bacterium]